MVQTRPRIFLSSTKIDLEPYRVAAKKAIGKADCDVIDMDQWTAEDAAPVSVCMEKVDQCDALVVVIGKRYGWVPKEHRPASITRLEVERARAKGKTVLAFLLDDAVEVPEEWDDDKVMQGIAARKDYKRLLDVTSLLEEFAKFKAELGEKTVSRFASPDSLALEINAALGHWQRRRLSRQARRRDPLDRHQRTQGRQERSPARQDRGSLRHHPERGT